MGNQEKMDYDEELDKKYLKERGEEEDEDHIPELDLDDPDNYDFGDTDEE